MITFSTHFYRKYVDFDVISRRRGTPKPSKTHRRCSKFLKIAGFKLGRRKSDGQNRSWSDFGPSWGCFGGILGAFEASESRAET